MKSHKSRVRVEGNYLINLKVFGIGYLCNFGTLELLYILSMSNHHKLFQEVN